MIKTTYLQALHYLNLSVEQNELLGVSAGSSISIGSSLSFYDIFNFKDPMDVAPGGFLATTGNTKKIEGLSNGIGYFLSLIHI